MVGCRGQKSCKYACRTSGNFLPVLYKCLWLAAEGNRPVKKRVEPLGTFCPCYTRVYGWLQLAKRRVQKRKFLLFSLPSDVCAVHTAKSAKMRGYKIDSPGSAPPSVLWLAAEGNGPVKERVEPLGSFCPGCTRVYGWLQLSRWTCTEAQITFSKKNSISRILKIFFFVDFPYFL